MRESEERILVESVEELHGSASTSEGDLWSHVLAPELKRDRQRRSSWHRRLYKKLLRRTLDRLGYVIYRKSQLGKNTRGVNPLFILETHHNRYGQPWCLGREQFDMLRARGLLPHHRLLDFGCGALRAGIWIIDYLNKGCYFGIDAHRPSLEAGATYELQLHRLTHKRPRLLHNRNMEVSYFGARFDWVLAAAVFIHFTLEQSEFALNRIAATLEPGGRLLLSHHLPLPLEILHQRYGLRLLEHQSQPCCMIEDRIEWFDFIYEPL
jgi:SAM-dependent methyltransferase